MNYVFKVNISNSSNFIYKIHNSNAQMDDFFFTENVVYDSMKNQSTYRGKVRVYVCLHSRKTYNIKTG